MLSVLSFHLPEDVIRNTEALGIDASESHKTTTTRAKFRLGKDPGTRINSLSGMEVVEEDIPSAILRGIMHSGTSDEGIAHVSNIQLIRMFVEGDRFKSFLTSFLNEKIYTPDRISVLNFDSKRQELYFSLLFLFQAFCKNYKYNKTEDIDKIFAEFVSILDSVPESSIDVLGEEVRKSLAQVHPTAFNFARDYAKVTGVTKKDIQRLISLEKALIKLDNIQSNMEIGELDMPKRTIEELDDKILKWRGEGKEIIKRILNI